MKSAEVDLVGYQPLPDSVDLCSVTEKASTYCIRTAVRAACHKQARLAGFVHTHYVIHTTDGSYCYGGGAAGYHSLTPVLGAKRLEL